MRRTELLPGSSFIAELLPFLVKSLKVCKILQDVHFTSPTRMSVVHKNISCGMLPQQHSLSGQRGHHSVLTDARDALVTSQLCLISQDLPRCVSYRHTTSKVFTSFSPSWIPLRSSIRKMPHRFWVQVLSPPSRSYDICHWELFCNVTVRSKPTPGKEDQNKKQPHYPSLFILSTVPCQCQYIYNGRQKEFYSHLTQ